MSDVSIRELRNHGGDVVDRAETLLGRWRHLPRIDARKLRADLDELLDARL